MNKRDTLIAAQHKLSHHMNFLHREFRHWEKKKLNDLNLMKAAWRSHDLKGIEKYAHDLAFDKEHLAKLRKDFLDCKAQIRSNKLELKGLPKEISSVYDDQEDLNRQRNILKMYSLPKVFKDIEKGRLELKKAFLSKKIIEVSKISMDLCKKLNAQQEFLTELDTIRKKMRENHKRIENLKKNIII